MSDTRDPSVGALTLAAVGLAALVGCANAGSGSDSESCEALCVSQLTLSFTDGREEFQLQVSSDELGSANITCPEEIWAGSVSEVSCAPGAVTLGRLGAPFPDTLNVSLDGGDVVVVTPEYGQPHELCGSTCADGAATLQ